MPRSELERLRVLQQLHRTFHASLNLTELLPRVLLETVEALEAEAGSLWLLDDAQQELVCHTATGSVAEQLEGVAVPLGAGIVGSVAATRRPEIVADTTTDRRFLFQVDQQTGFVTRSVVCAPLVIGDRCLGSVQILNSRVPDRRFERADLAFLESIAADAAQALENARLYAAAQRAQDLDTLLRLARELTATLNSQELLEHLVQSAASLTGCERAAVALTGQPGAPLRISATAGPPDAGLPARVQAVAGATEELYIPDTSRAESDPGPGPTPPAPPWDGESEEDPTSLAPHSALRTPHSRSVLVLPLRDADGDVGALYLESAREDAFPSRQRELAAILAQQATVAIRNALLYHQVPLLNVGGRFRGLRQSLLGPAGKGRGKWRAGAVALGLALCLLPWSYRAGGRFELRPATRVEVTAQTAGAVREVRVRESQAIQRGEVLAVLEDREAEREWTEAAARRDLARQALQAAQAAGDFSAYRQQLTTLRREEATVTLLEQRRAAARIRSPIAGVVLTPRIEERLGEVLSRGTPFCQVGALDPLEAEIWVSEDRVPEVAPGQTVLLKLSALPGRRFRARVTRIGVAPRREPGGAYFPVVCTIANPSALFRPGQEGWAKIVIGLRPLGYVLLNRAWNRTRLWWWRLW